MRTAADWLLDDTTFATCSLAILVDRFTTAFFDWDPATLALEIKHEYGIEPPNYLTDRVQAGAALFTTDLFHVAIEAFTATCNAFARSPVLKGVFLPPDLDDCLWGVTEAVLLEGPTEDEVVPFSQPVARYVGLLLQQSGIKEPPSMLAFAEYPETDVLPESLAGTEDTTMFEANWARMAQRPAVLESANLSTLQELYRQLLTLPVRDLDLSYVEQALTVLQS